MNQKKIIEEILRKEIITIGNAESAKTGQMWEFDVERLAKKICQLFEPIPVLRRNNGKN